MRVDTPNMFANVHSCIPLKVHPPEQIYLIDKCTMAYKITISMNGSDMVANVLKRCVWILRTCLQMHSCILLNPHAAEQI